MPSNALSDHDPAQTAGAMRPVAENRMLGIAMRMGAIFFLGIMFAMVKYAGREGVHVLESLFWRQLAGLPVVLIWLRMTGSLGDIKTRKPVGHAARMLVGLTAMAINYWAMTLLPLAQATTIGFAVPIFSTILAALLLKEPTGKWRWMAVVVGFAGVLIVVRPDASVDMLGASVALTGAGITALATIIIRKLGQTETTGAIVFWFSLTSLLPLGIVMPFVTGPHGGAAWGAIALLSLAGAAAQICLTLSLKYAPVSVVLPMDYFGLFWATLYGWLLFDMLPEASTWVGAPIIIVAGLVIVWREHRQRQRAAHKG